MSIGKKILFGLGIFIGIILLLILCFFVYLKLNSGDIKKIDDSVLNPSSQILSKEDNAYYDLKRASDSLVLPQDKSQVTTDLANGTSWDDTLANQVVDSNATALAAFNQASWKKGYQDPVVQADLKTWNADTTLTSIADIRKIAQISAIKSQILFRQGKEKEAFDNTLNIIYFGQVFENSPRETLIGYLVSIAIKGIGITNMQAMVPMSHLASGDLKNYVIKIDKFKDNKAGLQEAFRMEYVSLNNTKEQMIDQRGEGDQQAQALKLPLSSTLLKSSFYYKPNQTQKLYVEQYQNFVSNAAKKCDEIIPRPKRANTDFMSVIFAENVVGKILIDTLESSLSGVFSKRCQEEFSVIKTQISLASQAYKNDNGAYPTSLNLLSPNYLNTVDKQYDGQNLLYDAKTGTASLAQ